MKEIAGSSGTPSQSQANRMNAATEAILVIFEEKRTTVMANDQCAVPAN